MSGKIKLRLLINFFFMRFYFEIGRFVIEVAEKYDRKGKKLIDIGAGKGQYRGYFRNLEYYSQDVKQNGENSIDYVGDIERGLMEI